jgi:multidrug efflux system outer membrane protein
MNSTSLRLRPSVTLLHLGSLLILLTGCTVGPKYVRPTIPAPPAYRGPDETPVSSADQDSLGDQKWAQVFHEAELQDLIHAALENNYDVRIAARRVLEAQAQLRITRSQQFPTVAVGGTGIGADLGNSVIGNLGSSGNGLPSGTVVAGTFNLSAAWTPDFWGLYRRQTEAERALLLGQVWAQRAVRMTLVEQVTTSYLHLRSLDEQLAIAKQTFKARQESMELTRTLESAGSVPLADLRQAEELEYAASVQIPQLEQQIQQEENAIRLLLGKNPGTVDRADPNALAPVPQDLPVGLPSRLLERRPDIGQAEQQLIAANARIGVARAQFFPQLSITASGGVGGSDFSTIFDPDSRLIYGIGALTQPIFEGGKLRGQLQLSEETKREMVVNYQQTVAGALRDVSNALIAVRKQRTAREQQEKLVAATQDAARLARKRYNRGATNYLEVLTTDTNVFSAQLNLVNLREGEAQSLVELYAALGGGWE